MYFDLPAGRKKIYEKQVNKACSIDELEGLIEKEPLRHSAYPKLAFLYQREGRLQEAADTLYLALKLKGSEPVVAVSLAVFARAVDGKNMLFEAECILKVYSNPEYLLYLCEAAKCAISFSEKLGMSKLNVLYKNWLRGKKKYVQLYDNLYSMSCIKYVNSC